MKINSRSEPEMWNHTPQLLPFFDPQQRYSEQELSWWSERACGIACCVAILERRQRSKHSMLDILHEAIATDSYVPAGWVHRKLADILTRKGVPATAASMSRCEIEDTASTYDFICSVALGFPLNTEKKGGHLVACGGIGEKGIQVMDPSVQGASRTTISLDTFFHSYSGRAVVVPPA